MRAEILVYVECLTVIKFLKIHNFPPQLSFQWNFLLLLYNKIWCYVDIHFRIFVCSDLLQCNSSDRLFLHPVTGSRAFIFVRKTLSGRLRDREGGSTPAQARREGPTFFDEDDACGRIQELSYSLSELLRLQIKRLPQSLRQPHCGYSYDLLFSLFCCFFLCRLLSRFFRLILDIIELEDRASVSRKIVSN